MSVGASRVLLISPQYLRDNTVINDNTDEKILIKSIRTAEDKYIKPLIGSNLYYTLLDKITGGTVSAQYQTLLEDYAIPCLLEYSLLEYLPFSAFKIKDAGVGQQTKPEYTPASMSDIGKLKEEVRTSAQFYGDALVRYLKANASSFPEYLVVRNQEDINGSSGDYFSGIQFTDGWSRRTYDYKDRFKNINL